MAPAKTDLKQVTFVVLAPRIVVTKNRKRIGRQWGIRAAVAFFETVLGWSLQGPPTVEDVVGGGS